MSVNSTGPLLTTRDCLQSRMCTYGQGWPNSAQRCTGLDSGRPSGNLSILSYYKPPIHPIYLLTLATDILQGVGGDDKSGGVVPITRDFARMKKIVQIRKRIG